MNYEKLLEMKRKMLCAEIEMNGLKAENEQRSVNQQPMTYSEGDFYRLIDKYDLGISIKQEIIKGEWLEIENSLKKYKCSICGKEKQYKDNFCPNCGADMRRKEE
jgi:rRNA maturation endonuclease Nob1